MRGGALSFGPLITTMEVNTIEADEVNEVQRGQSYAALLQSLGVDSSSLQHRKKRRRVEQAHADTIEIAHQSKKPIAKTLPSSNVDADNRDANIVDVNGHTQTTGSEVCYDAHFVYNDMAKLASLKSSREHIVDHKENHKQLGRITFSGKDAQAIHSRSPWIENLRPKLYKELSEALKVSDGETMDAHLSELQKALAKYIFAYQDLLFSPRSHVNGTDILLIVNAHVMNHILKTRNTILKNNTRLSQSKSEGDYKDQGFTRPKVLYLLPTRNSCLKIAEQLITLSGAEQQENKARFEKSFASTEPDVIVGRKPDDYTDLFFGNDDDMFRIGVKFTRKTMKFYSPFYDSDIIFASPLGLRMAVEKDEKAETDSDWLSSIEIVVVDQTDALTMQNWEHVEFAFKHLNSLPKESRGCDFSRIKGWYLDGDAQYYRQNIVLSQFLTPEISSLFRKYSKNIDGSIKISPQYVGVVGSFGLKIQQTFSRIAPSSPAEDPEDRFEYFLSVVLNSITRHDKDGVLVFVPSYMDFIRIRNHITELNLNAGFLSEYSSSKEAARAKSHFMTGKSKSLLYTERAHHFRRYKIAGVKEVIMYGLPNNPTFYRELVEMPLLNAGRGKCTLDEVQVRVVFSRWDALKLERIVGTAKLGIMMQDKGNTFKFS